jgi:hypothetical protein
MPLLKVQFNHPGNQKPFSIGNGYRNIGGNIIREWNNDMVHYRKFLLNKGEYLDNISDSKPKKTDLYFWGEWEGNSIFSPIVNRNYQILPNGIHRAFHSTVIRGGQNTDPYIFGKEFKYCICKQTGNLCNLDPNSLILFGSTFPSLGKFYIDTVFVVKNNVSATHVQASHAAGYSKTYQETTLEQLSEYLGVPHRPSNCKLYHSQTWWDNKEYFSFVPCKLELNGNGFERLFIDLNNPILNLSSNPTGKSFLKNCTLSPEALWNEIVKIAKEQGFKLGIRFNEPNLSNILNGQNEIKKKPACNTQ